MRIDTKASHFRLIEAGPAVCPGSRQPLQPYEWRRGQRLYAACRVCALRFGPDDVWSIHNRGAIVPDHLTDPVPDVSPTTFRLF